MGDERRIRCLCMLVARVFTVFSQRKVNLIPKPIPHGKYFGGKHAKCDGVFAWRRR